MGNNNNDDAHKHNFFPQLTGVVAILRFPLHLEDEDYIETNTPIDTNTHNLTEPSVSVEHNTNTNTNNNNTNNNNTNTNNNDDDDYESWYVCVCIYL